jgi:hypothetical protein
MWLKQCQQSAEPCLTRKFLGRADAVSVIGIGALSALGKIRNRASS